MFSWNISRSAEKMFSRWAMKRLCHFLLKKKLGKFILGDIDLNQLDVQLGAGIIQLSDVALNVDCINEKFGTAAVMVKEGTIGSLKVTMPWKEGGCRIDIDDIEVVLAPRRSTVHSQGVETCPCSNITETVNSHEVEKPGSGAFSSHVANTSVEVHEGVKTIARLVKWLLTSFHVKIRRLIVAFDPILEGGNKKGHDRMLVLRVSEVECGTQISDSASSRGLNIVPNVLGLAQLTNFMSFQGAVLELVLLDGPEDLSSHDSSTGTPDENLFRRYCSFGNMTSVISGEKGGFSGSIKLSLPWKDGSLDINKVDADLQIDPIQLCIKPSTLRSFIFIRNMCVGDKSKDQAYAVPLHNSTTSLSCMHLSNKGLMSNEGLANSNIMPKESFSLLLSESRLISDWVNKIEEDRIEEEPDFMASVDQFFECFDGLRSSQSALANSIMWNWTCSVFSAITVASNLATGSINVPSEQQHGETKFNAVIAKVSLFLFFSDEDQGDCRSAKEDKTCNGSHLHCLCAHFVGVSVSCQVCAQEMDLEATVQHVQIDDHLYPKKDLVDIQHGITENIRNVITSLRKVQDGIQSTFNNFKGSKKNMGSYHPTDYADMNFQSSSKFPQIEDNSYDSSINLLKTFGDTHCNFKMNSSNLSGSINGRTSFSLIFAPFACWVNFDVISLVQDYLKGTANDFDKREVGYQVDDEAKIDGFSHVDERSKSSCQRSSCLTTNNPLEGNVFLPNARIIFCFPLENKKASCSYLSFDHFIVFDITSTKTRGEDIRKTLAGAKRRHPVTTPCFLDVSFSDFYLFFLQSISEETTGNEPEPCGRQEVRFSIEQIVSIVNETGNLSLVSVFWQGRPATGPWVAKKAKNLVSGDNRSESGVADKSSEFASVVSLQDNKDFDHQTKQEILLSSELLFHVQLPAVYINLDRCQYVSLCSLLDQLLQRFSSDSEYESVKHKGRTPVQTSLLVELDSLMFSLATEPTKEVKVALFSELPGSWVHLTLQVDKFEILSVSSIGGIEDTKFLHIAHHQGSLRGSTSECHDQEFLLISCSNSVSGRGDGEGLNVLSPRHAGSVILNMWDPVTNHSFTSVTVKCATIVAVGGRLDWFVTISSFFTFQSSNSKSTNDIGMDKTPGSSVSFTMIDVGLTYEPCTEFLNDYQGSELKQAGLNKNECKAEPFVACLLAASSLKLLSTSAINCKETECKIRVQDIGFLISKASERKFSNVYSAAYLRKIGYVKVGQEALLELVFRMNCANGHSWEVECAESHIILNTCHDTTLGLIRLSTQLQVLFAPDMEDYVVHLENRWNNVQHQHENNNDSSIGGFAPMPCQLETSGMDKRLKGINLMDAVCDDTFNLNQSSDFHGRKCESHTSASSVDDSPVSAYRSLSGDENISDFIEEYFSADFHPLPQLGSQHEISENCNCDISEDQTGSARWYVDRSLNILENHTSKVEQSRMLKSLNSEGSRSDVDNAEGSIIFKNLNVVWELHGGSDWPNIQNAALESTRNRARDSTLCLELALSGIGVGYVVYPYGGICSSELCLTIQDVCLNDRSVNAPWKLVLGYYRSKKHPRKFASDALKINLETVRPNPSIRVEENRLCISLLPMRLHLHQSQLDFLIGFFGENNLSAETYEAKTMGLCNSAEPFQETDSIQTATINKEAFLPYFQKFDILPFTIRVDYHPSRVDLSALRGGKYVELVNLVPWKGVELHLKRVQGVGHYGLNSVLETILGEWLEDISQNQIHKLLKGLPPIKSIVSVGSGAAKLVSLPVKGYKEDHGLLRGMQRGTFAFLRSISIEAIELGVHLAAGAHNILLQAEYLLANIPPSAPWQIESKAAASVKINQPSDAQQGIQQACQSITDGLGKTASALVQTPIKKYQRGAGVGCTLVTAVQSAPAAAVAPASAAARAVHCALLGFRNSLDPEHMRESMEKYLGSPSSNESMQ